jgi:Secretion system C-terminal sorting domain
MPQPQQHAPFRLPPHLLNTVPPDSMANTSTDSATGVQMADDPTADTVVQCYRNYDALYIRYLKNTMSLADTAQVEWLAKQCPFTHGAVVYKARVLHDVINNAQKIFSFDCDAYDRGGDREVGTTSTTVVAESDGQKYTLSPNPNSGSFTLRQAITDDLPVNIEVLNIVGQSVFTSKVIFVSGRNNVKLLDVAPGLYLISLSDSKGRNFKFKFFIQ